MDSAEDYEFDVDTMVPVERDHTIEYERKRANSPSSSENEDDNDDPPVLVSFHTMDIVWTL